MMSLKALCAGVMTLCVASLSFVSCYDDSALNAKVDELGNEVSALDARLQAVEALTANLEALTARVDALYTLKFQVTSSNELQYSFDGGKTWVSTKIVLAEELECECEEPIAVALEDNGDSVTITVGNKSFTIQKPEEIVFEIRAGKVYFESEGTQTVAMKSTGIEDISVLSYPKGWWAEINSDGLLEVTAPNYADTQSEMDWETWEEIPAKYAAYGYVKVHACGADGSCMVGKLLVEVSQTPMVVNAYDGMAYFQVLGNWGTFYYGISTKDSFEADIQPLLSDMNTSGWSDLTNNDGETYIEVSLTELLGSEPKDGVEYVVWALVEDYSKATYNSEDFVKAFYSNVKVSAVEDESKRNAYNIDVTVSVEGAQSYIAVAMPDNPYASAEGYKAQMAEAYSYGEIFGKQHFDTYSGTLLDIAYGTTYSSSGAYQPNWKFYLLVMPIDGRPADAYTEDNVYLFDFTTSSLQAGGSVAANVKQVTEYMGKVFSYDDWTYHEQLITLDPMTQLGVELTPSSENWKVAYVEWMSDEMWTEYGASDETIVEFLLQGYGMTPAEVEKNYVLDVLPEQTAHFVAFFVDNDGKYGQLAKLSLTSEPLATTDIALEMTDNTVEGSLLNTTTLEVTLTPSAEVSKYKYVWSDIDYAGTYTSLNPVQLAQKLHFDTEAVEVAVEELVDGKLVVEDNEYGNFYFLAVLAYDAAGLPATEAVTLEYGCEFRLENVITDNLVAEPTVTFTIPEVFDGWGEPFLWYSDGTYQYSLNYTVAPVEGTEVVVLMLDPATLLDYGYDFAAKTPIQKASDLWAGAINAQAYYTFTVTEETVIDARYMYGDGAIAPIIMVSWKDADGNYYYKEISLAEECEEMKAIIDLALAPNNIQLSFTWTDMYDAPSCLDLGLTTPGYFAVAFDLAAMYGDQLPPEMVGLYMQYMAWEYTVEPTDATSGKFIIMSLDHFGDPVTTEGTYSEWNGTTCVVDFPMLYLEGVTMTVVEEPYTLYIEQPITGGDEL